MSSIVSPGVLGFPDPVGGLLGGSLLGGSLFGGGGNPLSWVFNGLAGDIESGIASAATSAFNELEKLINNSAGTISFSGTSWWGAKVDAPGGLWATLLVIAAAVMLGCVCLAVIQGALAGDPATGLRSVAVEVPRSVLGMATVVALTGVLVQVTDGASAAVLPSVGSNFGDWFSKGATAGFFSSFVTCLVLLGALLTWVELVIRQGLIFLLVALSPLALAVRVWPAAAGVWRKMVELGVALIVAKFVIALALALGADALAGSVGASGATPSVTAMATGAGLMLIAGLSPFVLLRIMPGVEAAVAAQGISRMPARTALTGLSAATSVMLLGRLAGAGAAAARPANIGAGPGPAPSPATARLPVASVSLARAAALDVGSRPALGPGGDRGLPPGPKALPGPDGGDRP